MSNIPDWRGKQIEIGKSSGGVLAVANAWDNVIRTGVTPWPPPELIQKVYQSRHAASFLNRDHASVTAQHSFYSDLQSLHSEDAITWSAFGPLIYATPGARDTFVRQLLRSIDVPCKDTGTTRIWLWRRLPHPDTLVPGGPEIDFGIQTEDIFLLGEAKWLSSISASQGVSRDKDQLMLRHEFCEKYGRRLLPSCKQFIVLGVSMKGGMIPNADADAAGVTIRSRDTTWDSLTSLSSHPASQELRAYLNWKLQNSMMR
jgi:hypothetical protein